MGFEHRLRSQCFGRCRLSPSSRALGHLIELACGSANKAPVVGFRFLISVAPALDEALASADPSALVSASELASLLL